MLNHWVRFSVSVIISAYVLDLDATPVQPAENNIHLVMKVWGADEGMPSGSVTSVAQTPEGYLWIGSLHRGLMRFDGDHFESFLNNSDDSLDPLVRTRGVLGLVTDHVGRLWVSIYNNNLVTWEHGEFRLAYDATNAFATGNVKGHPYHQLLWSDAGRVVFLEGNDSLLCGCFVSAKWQWQTVILPRANKLRQVCADASGRIWSLVDKDELACWDDGRIKQFHPPGLENQKIAVLSTDSLGRIWVGTDQTLSLWESDHFVKMNPPDESPLLCVSQILPSGSGKLWVEANGRVRRMSNGRWEAECKFWGDSLQRHGAAEFLKGDRWGDLWAKNSEGLIYLSADGSMQTLTTRDGLPSSAFDSFYTDRENNAWIGYYRGVLLQVHPGLFGTIGAKQGLPEALLNSVCMSSSGTVWMGSVKGTLIRYEGGQCTNLDLNTPPVNGSRIATVDASGRIWVGDSYHGLMELESGGLRLVAGGEHFHTALRLMLPTRDGRLWVATMRELWMLREGKLVQHYGPESFPKNTLLAALAEGVDGSLWVGTFSAGLLHLPHGAQTFQSFTPTNQYSPGRFWALSPAADGSVWIGSSDGGLLRYRSGKFSQYTRKQGLPSNCITQLLADGRGHLWFGTDAGVARMDQNSVSLVDRGLEPALRVSQFDKSDGLSTLGTAIEYQPNCWRGEDGTLLFTMADSVSYVKPEAFKPNHVSPGVAVEEVRANGKLVWPLHQGEVISLTGLPSVTARQKIAAPIQVGPGRQDLEINFTALSFNSPKGARLSYQLEGLDTSWSPPRTERYALYRAVPPGKYSFHVRACNRDGIWNEGEVELPLLVLPHFWQTTWFFITGMTGIVLLAVSAVILPLRAQYLRRVAGLTQQQVLDRERARVAHDLHDDLGAGLTNIRLISSLAQRAAVGPERMRVHLREISESAREMVSALDEIVWAVSPQNDSADSIGGYLCDYAQKFLRPTEIACLLDIDGLQPGPAFSFEQRHQLFLAYKEALNNVVKHAEATTVWIRIRSSESDLKVVVEDNGVGLPPGPSLPGADGLKNMSSRLVKIGGRCEINRLAEGGTAVQFVLPIKRQP